MSVVSWLKQEPVPCQVFPCSHGTAQMAYGTPHQAKSTRHNLASLPHHPLPPWWKWENNVTSADRFIKTQKTLQKPFDIIISNAVRERCRLAIIIESNWSKKKKRWRKGEHSYKAVKLIIWSTGVFRDLDSASDGVCQPCTHDLLPAGYTPALGQLQGTVKAEFCLHQSFSLTNYTAMLI